MNLANWLTDFLLPIVNILSTLIALSLLGLSCLFLAECYFGQRQARKEESSSALQTSDDFLILMPAHNEAAIIETTLNDLTPVLGDLSRVVVVADNCSDGTAEMARRLGAKVLERANDNLKGKGYALAYGLEYIFEQPQKIVIVLDADCSVDGNGLDRLAGAALEQNGPVQANYALDAPSKEGIDVRVALFAWRVKNFLRPMGLKYFGQPCQLMGTGMAFPKGLLRNVQIASGNIVEDIQMGLDLGAVDHPPQFEPTVTVRSSLPGTDSAAETQRTRWEHGHLSTILEGVPKALKQAVREKNIRLMSMAMDLAIPPLTFFAILLMVQLIYTAGLILLGSQLPFILAMVTLSIFFVAIWICWAAVGRTYLRLTDVWEVARFVFGKLSVYIKFFQRKRPQTWVRTER